MVNSYLWTLDLTRVRFKCGFRQAPILGEVANDNMTLENSAMKIVWKGMITDFDRDVLSAQKLTSGQSLDDFYEHPYERVARNACGTTCRRRSATIKRRFDKDTFLSQYKDSFHVSWSGNRVIETSFTKVIKDVIKEITS
ncbi:hypothetical protein L596_010395 [Steinernema carpocapsae]|uniref:Uncharacterized protein n=1 Tax=Steinernema carpocapsae TaxID=34508 RepID=A0A4U5PJJ4_STECR|nr:hypothetical protein L596_010395 [Steinernema carpocapsae]